MAVAPMAIDELGQDGIQPPGPFGPSTEEPPAMIEMPPATVFPSTLPSLSMIWYSLPSFST